KSFVISLLLMPLLMVGSGLISHLVKKQTDIEEKRFAIVDRTPGSKILSALKIAVARHNKSQIFDPETGKQFQAVFDLVEIKPSADDPQSIDQQRFDLSDRILKGEFFGFVEIGPDVSSLPASAD